MFAPVLASAQVRFSADASDMKPGLDRISKSIGATIGKIAGVAAAATAMFFAVRRIFRRLAKAYDDTNDPLNRLAVNLAGIGNSALDGLYPIVAFVKSTLEELGPTAEQTQERFDNFAEGVQSAMKRVSEVVINIGTVLTNVGKLGGIFADGFIGAALSVRDAFRFVFAEYIPDMIGNMIDGFPMIAEAFQRTGVAVALIGRDTFGFLFGEYIPRLMENSLSLLKDFGTAFASGFELIRARIAGDTETAARAAVSAGMAAARIGQTLDFNLELSDEAKSAMHEMVDGISSAWDAIKTEAEFTLSDDAKARFRSLDRGLVEFDRLFQQNKQFLNAIRPRNQQQEQRQLGAGFIGIERAMDRVQEQLLKQDTERQQLGELQRLNVAANRIEGAVRSMKTEVVYG